MTSQGGSAVSTRSLPQRIDASFSARPTEHDTEEQAGDHLPEFLLAFIPALFCREVIDQSPFTDSVHALFFWFPVFLR